MGLINPLDGMPGMVENRAFSALLRWVTDFVFNNGTRFGRISWIESLNDCHDIPQIDFRKLNILRGCKVAQKAGFSPFSSNSL